MQPVAAGVTERRLGGALATVHVRDLGDAASPPVAHYGAPSLLVHCGFTRTATIADPEDGVDDDVWRWELELR